jgi:hypothetical protein
MSEAGYGGIGLLVKRVEPEHWVIRHLLGTNRQKLGSDGIVVWIAPVDKAQKVRRNPESHRRVLNAGGDIVIEGIRGERTECFPELTNVGNGVAALERMGVKNGRGNVLESWNAAPEVIAPEVFVLTSERVWARKAQRRLF